MSSSISEDELSSESKSDEEISSESLFSESDAALLDDSPLLAEDCDGDSTGARLRDFSFFEFVEPEDPSLDALCLDEDDDDSVLRLLEAAMSNGEKEKKN